MSYQGEIDYPDDATVWVQYKGTEICLDFRCICGDKGEGHFDGYGAYALQCGACGQIYLMPQTLKLIPVNSLESPYWLKHPEMDDDVA